LVQHRRQSGPGEPVERHHQDTKLSQLVSSLPQTSKPITFGMGKT
jgi:hypothetical protein